MTHARLPLAGLLLGALFCVPAQAAPAPEPTPVKAKVARVVTLAVTGMT